MAINSEKFLKTREYQTTCPASWEICMQVRKQQGELDIEQQAGSKLGKEYVKAVYILSLCLFNLLPGEIWKTSDMQMTPHLWQKVKKN